MLAIVTPADLDEVLALCERWEIRASVVGKVTDTGRFRVFDGLFDAAGARRPTHHVPACHSPTFPCASLGDGPVYDRPLARPADQDALPGRRSGRLAARARSPTAPISSGELLALLATPTIADKSWVWHQYDHQLFLNTVAGPGARRRGAAPEGNRPRARAVDRRQGPVLPARPPHGWPARRARGGAQRRVRRRAPARAGQLPQLRQPRAPRGDVAVLRGGRRHERGVRGARASRWSAATSASTTSRAAPTSIRRPSSGVLGIIDELRRAAARGASRAPGSASSCSATPGVELGGSEWAAVVHGLDGGMPPGRRPRRRRAGSTSSSGSSSRTRSSTASTTAPTAVSRSRSRRWRSRVSAASGSRSPSPVRSPARSRRRPGASASRRRVSSSRSRPSWSARCCSGPGPTTCPRPSSATRAWTWAWMRARRRAGRAASLVVEGPFGVVVDVGLADATRAWREAIPLALGAGVTH